MYYLYTTYTCGILEIWCTGIYIDVCKENQGTDCSSSNYVLHVYEERREEDSDKRK